MSIFKYPPLPAGDGLRLLVLQPGRFADEFQGQLKSVTFASKPKYIALSYTWSDRDESHASVHIDKGPTGYSLPTDKRAVSDYINIEGQRLPIGHNLALALHYLRSEQGWLHLWTDQVCINQNDISERNSQVALMAFIYTRAMHVVSWLGLPEREPGRISAATRSSKWQSGQSQTLATGEVVFSKWGQDAFPIHEDPYWTRVWIVQEVCLARSIMFLQGQYVWSEQQVLASIKNSASDKKQPMDRLLQARKKRFTDEMRLETLVENFMHCGCGEPRDRVYGLLGLANDVASIDATDAANLRGLSEFSGEKRGRGMIPVDYKRSFYDIWCDVVLHMYLRAMPKLDFGKEEGEQADERRARVVRFAGVVQNALAGKVDDEVKQSGFLQAKASIKPVSPPFVQVKAYIAGRIQCIGPTYSDFFGSYREQQAWLSSWHDHYTDTSDLAKLREMEETYTAKIIDFGDADIARIASFENYAVAWSPLREFSPADYNPTLGQLPAGEPTRFMGSDHCMGLAPHGAEVGDIVLRFWDCDAAVVMRLRCDPLYDELLTGPREVGRSEPSKENLRLSLEQAGLYELVGRADIAEPHIRKDGIGDYRAKDGMKVNWDRLTTTARYVWMDLATLQKITVAIET